MEGLATFNLCHCVQGLLKNRHLFIQGLGGYSLVNYIHYIRYEGKGTNLLSIIVILVITGVKGLT